MVEILKASLVSAARKADWDIMDSTKIFLFYQDSSYNI
jgi:hypothetical protein